MAERRIQHNPAAGDAPGPFIELVRACSSLFLELRVDIERVIPEGELVVSHGLIRTSPHRGTAAAGIFRLEEGTVVEHRDVLQPGPATAANDNRTF